MFCVRRVALLPPDVVKKSLFVLAGEVQRRGVRTHRLHVLLLGLGGGLSGGNVVCFLRSFVWLVFVWLPLKSIYQLNLLITLDCTKMDDKKYAAPSSVSLRLCSCTFTLVTQ